MCPKAYVDHDGNNLCLVSSKDLKEMCVLADQKIKSLKDQRKRIIDFHVMHVNDMEHGDSTDGSTSKPDKHDHDFACMICFDDK